MFLWSPMLNYPLFRRSVDYVPLLYDIDMAMKIVRVTICVSALTLMAGCAEPPPPVSVTDFMENPRLLEATMVRCGQNRAEMKYESECVNAREAVNRLERVAERERRQQLEAQSERKRKALRQTQEAAAAARRRADEERRRREEEAYLGLFDDGGSNASPPASTSAPAENAPTVSVDVAPEPTAEEPAAEPVAEPVSEPTPDTSDLNAVREELRRRSNQN
jgi:hypothetical protein